MKVIDYVKYKIEVIKQGGNFDEKIEQAYLNEPATMSYEEAKEVLDIIVDSIINDPNNKFNDQTTYDMTLLLPFRFKTDYGMSKAEIREVEYLSGDNVVGLPLLPRLIDSQAFNNFDFAINDTQAFRRENPTDGTSSFTLFYTSKNKLNSYQATRSETPKKL